MDKIKGKLIYERSKLFEACADVYKGMIDHGLTGERHSDLEKLKSVIKYDDCIITSPYSEYFKYLQAGNRTPADDFILKIVEISRNVKEMKSYSPNASSFNSSKMLQSAALAIKSFNDDELGWRSNESILYLNSACQDIATDLEVSIAKKALDNISYLGKSYSNDKIDKINKKFQGNYEVLSMIASIKSNPSDFTLHQAQVDMLAKAIVKESSLDSKLRGVEREGANLLKELEEDGITDRTDLDAYKKEAYQISREHKIGQKILNDQAGKVSKLREDIQYEIKTYKALPKYKDRMEKMDKYFGLQNNYIKDYDRAFETYRKRVDPKLLKRQEKERKRRNKLEARRLRREKINFKLLLIPFIYIGEGLSFLGRCFLSLFSGIGKLFTIIWKAIVSFFSLVFSSKVGIIVAIVLAVAIAGGTGISIAVSKNNELKHAHENWCIQDAGTLEKTPTCFEEGEYVYRCIRHGEVERVKLPKVHKFGPDNKCVDCGYELDLTNTNFETQLDLGGDGIMIRNATSNEKIINVPPYIDGKPVTSIRIYPSLEGRHEYEQINIYTAEKTSVIFGDPVKTEPVSDLIETKGYEYYEEFYKNYVKEINIIGDVESSFQDAGTPECRYNYIGNVEKFIHYVDCKNINFIYDVKLLRPFDRNELRSVAIKKNTQIYNVVEVENFSEKIHSCLVDAGNIYLEEGNDLYYVDDNCLYDKENNLILKATYRYKNIFDWDDYKKRTLLPGFKIE